MTTTAKFAALTALASALALAGCMSGPAGNRGPAPIRTSSIFDGQWTDTQGVSVSTFSNGSFQTVANDTGNKLSEGSYRQTSQNSVEISMTSLIRQSFTRVNCNLASPALLNCTNAEGQQFSLTRRG